MPRFTSLFRNVQQLAHASSSDSKLGGHDLVASNTTWIDGWAEDYGRLQHGRWSNSLTDVLAQAATPTVTFGFISSKPDEHPEGLCRCPACFSPPEQDGDSISPPPAPEPTDLGPLPVLPALVTGPSVIETADAAADISTTYLLQVGQSAQGNISSNADQDWFGVDLTAGVTYSIALVGTGTNNLQDPFLRLLDSSGTIEWATNDDGLNNNNSVLTFTPGSTGRYYVSAEAFLNPTPDSGQYGITVTADTRPSFDALMGAGAIDADRSWSTPGTGAVVTYAFRATPASYTVSGSNIASFTQLTATQITAVRAALQAWSEVSGISFVEVNPGGYSNNATMLFANYSDATDGAGAFAFFPGSTASTSQAGDVWLNTNAIPTVGAINAGSYAYSAIMHEIGHAIGLSHPGTYNAGPGQTITYEANAQFTEDSDQYSLMSYFDEAKTGAQFFGHPETPMMFDMLAAQNIYGANLATRAGDTVYGFNSTAGTLYNFILNPTPAFTIWDGGGIDTIDASGFATNQTVNLNEGQFSSVGSGTNNIAIAIGVVIENAIGGLGNDTILGNAANNRLEGGDGTDTLQGGDGGDTLIGGAGADAINGGAGEDIAMYGASAAVSIDLLTGAITGGEAAGDTLTGIENVSGSAFNDSIWGTTGANKLYGLAGNDILDGRTGADQLFGGDGSDWLEGGGGADAIDGGIGDDVAAYGASASAVSVDLQTGATSGGDAAGDTFTGVESLSGSQHNDSFWGDSGANRLYGRNGNDILDGRAGNDQLFGGDGHDWLEGGLGGDVLDGGTGDDTAAYGSSTAAVSVDLQTGAVSGGNAVGDTFVAIESVSGSSFNDSIWGNASANRLYGRNGNDIIDGRAGNDQLFGGDGIDWLEGGAGADVIDGGNGDDTAAYGSSTAAVTIDLQAGTATGGVATGDTFVGIESLSGSAHGDSLSGNTAANRIYGRNGNDTLAGREGNDTLEGGNDNDTFVFTDNSGVDRINDFDDFGDDVIQLSIAGITDFASVQAVMTQSGADVLIDFATTDIILVNTALASVGVDDFTFV